MEELLDQEHPHPLLRLAPPLPPRPPSYGLLQELLGGRLDVLVSDAIQNPDRYDADTLELLGVLGSDPAKLQQMNATEQQMLNRAVIDYAAFKPKGAAAAVKPQKARAPKVLLEEGDFSDEDGREPSIEEHGAGAPMSNYWWMNL